MLIRSLETLKPRMENLAVVAIEEIKNDRELRKLGVTEILVNETFRELSTQLVYWMRGRMKDPQDVQAAYKRVWGWTPTLDECSQSITWTLDSKHLQGLAIDLVPSRDGKTFWWNAPKEVWDRMGTIGKQCGLKWGGDWKGRADTPHFEL